ncbi:MAG: hypothetical protein ACLFMO_01530 [Eubacteriales bacterium]
MNEINSQAYIDIEITKGELKVDKNYDYSNMYYPYMPYDKRRGLYYNYQTTPVQLPFEDNDGIDEMDLDYMKKMYPDLAKQIQYYIDEECDKMEYDGSYMYDEYPDREAVNMISEKIYERVMEDPAVRINEVSDEKKDEEVESQQFGYRRFGLRDLIQVMLLNEIFGRRRRYYRRRRRPRYRYPYSSDYYSYY